MQESTETEKQNLSANEDEDSEKELQRHQKRSKTYRENSNEFGKMELKRLTPEDLDEAFGDDGIDIGDMLDEHKTCFERLYVKQPHEKAMNCFFAMRLKKRKNQIVDAIYDPMERLMQRSNMEDPINGLVIYEIATLVTTKEDDFCFEPTCDYDETQLLIENPPGLEIWVGPNAMRQNQDDS